MMSFLKRLRGKSGKGGAPNSADAGAKQMAMLRRLPKILRYVPGTAQDVRAYFLAMQFWLAGSDDNFAGMVRLLVGRYAGGPRAHLVGRLAAPLPVEYPDVGLYHPALPNRIATRIEDLPVGGGSPCGERSAFSSCGLTFSRATPVTTTA